MVTSRARPLIGRRLDEAMIAAGRYDRMFRHGWGDHHVIARFMVGETVAERAVAPLEIDWDEEQPVRLRTPTRITPVMMRSDGRYRSPHPELPREVSAGRLKRLRAAGRPPVGRVLALAGAREEGFGLREWIWGPMVEEGYELYFFEVPYYGSRRRDAQRSATVLTVSDHVLLNEAIILEGRALLGRLAGPTPLGLAGFSMGGFMAARIAAAMDEALALVAIAAGVTPRPIFTESAYVRAIDFGALTLPEGSAAEARERLGALFDHGRVRRAPRRPDAVVLIGCRDDALVPPAQTEALHELWPGSELRWLEGGHVASVLVHRAPLRQAVRDAFARLTGG